MNFRGEAANMHDKHSQYMDENGEVTMCESCKRVKDAKTDNWILDTILYVEPPDDVIYEICHECLNK